MQYHKKKQEINSWHNISMLITIFLTVIMTDFSDLFRKIIMRYKRIGYNLNVMRQFACLVINPITVDGYAALLIARRWIVGQTL